MKEIRTVFGVDFSGAALAGKTAWVAETAVEDGRLRLVTLQPLEHLAGAAERDPALAGLVRAVRASDDALWAMDFPFSVPLALEFGGWREQLDLVQAWEDGASAFGHHCLATSKRLTGIGHVRRRTDVDTKTPFDCYHYRIIYQTFFGMRAVLGPLAGDRETCVLPFEPQRRENARRIVVEACPSSTLKRLNLPHQNYKQPGGKPPDEKRKATRRLILKGLATHIEIGPSPRRRLMTNPGGDALDAVIAAVGGWHGFRADPPADPIYAREGRVFA